MRPGRPSALTGLWVSAAANSFARTAVQLALGWITLQATGSPFMVGAVSAIRMAPQIPLGIPAGMLADWVDRRRLVVGVTAASTVVALTLAMALAAVLGSGAIVLPVVFGAALTLGLLDTLRTTATQAYAYDLVPTNGAARGLAFVNLGAQLLGTLGGLAGGYTLERYGAPATFILIASVLAIGSALPMIGRAAPATAALEPEVRAARPRPSLRASLGLMRHNRLVAALVLTIVLAEILGFSSNSVMPTFARDVLVVGAAGLGAMTAARSIGGVLGLLVLTRVGTRERTGAVMLGAAVVLGVALLGFSQTPRLEVALVWLAVIGAACAVMDTLGQVLLQQSVPEQQRGAAMGTWVFAIGFGPVGHLSAGALTGAIGAGPTLAIFGGTLVVFGAVLWRYAGVRVAR